MKFFPWGSSPQAVLALDIGTEVVKALVLRIEEHEDRKSTRLNSSHRL